MNDTCKHCGQPESAHHAFEPGNDRPAGCVCDPDSWDGATEIPPICKTYAIKGPFLVFCDRCEHDEGCHREDS